MSDDPKTETEIERCFKCDQPTGRAGAYDDSLLDEEGNVVCEECWDRLPVETPDDPKPDAPASDAVDDQPVNKWPTPWKVNHVSRFCLAIEDANGKSLIFIEDINWDVDEDLKEIVEQDLKGLFDYITKCMNQPDPAAYVERVRVLEDAARLAINEWSGQKHIDALVQLREVLNAAPPRPEEPSKKGDGKEGST